ncbi:MAG: hypothetical protein KAW89_11255, partial [Armatimonadetes bacterium]|nr:hypothetical protein [Armatimonadota bacterium]
LLALGHLLEQINRIGDEGIRFFFRGVFSGILHRASRTYYLDAAHAGGGDSSIFRQYRYWIPERPDERNVWQLFEYRYKTRLRHHLEDNKPFVGQQSDLMILQGDARELPLRDESVQYIYADPPYGANIQYVGLSTMWHAWLGHPTNDVLLEREIVEGGDLDKDDMEYMALLADTFPEMHRVLAWDRYLSFVFAHKRIAFWDTIIKAAEAAGFQYVNTVVQPTKRPSYHKINNPLKVLSGQLIINFCKKRTPSVLARQVMGADIVAIVRNAAERAIVEHQGAKTEEIYHTVIPELLENGLLGEVADEMPDLTPILNEWFDYDAALGEWYIKPSTKIGSAIPLPERLRFYLKDFLIRCQRENRHPTFDEIVFEIMPRLKNGRQPRNQEILNELEKLATPVDEAHWIYRPELVLDLELEKQLGLPPLTPLSEQRILGGDPHNEMIYRLAKLGIVAGYQVHIGKREQSERWHGEDFAELSLADLPVLPAWEGLVRKAVGQIDCLWLESSGWPVFAFEVEESTAITSGIDRFIELLKVDPNIAGKIALVVPFRRRRKLNRVLSQSHYVGAPMYMENKIAYLYYRDVVDVYKKFTGREFEKKDLYEGVLNKVRRPSFQ